MPETAPAVMQSELTIVKEFCPYISEPAYFAGKLIVRSQNYGSSLNYFDRLFDVLEDAAIRFEPPIAIDRSLIEVVNYDGPRYKHMFGLELNVPLGHEVPVDFTRIYHLENKL